MRNQTLGWLHGVRALAALFVVAHHAWLMGYGSYPDNAGPAVLAPLVYGHLAVAVFIVVSGYSLTLSPQRHDLTLPDGGAGFLRRRFWRIVPPYWMSLLLSAAVVWLGLSATPTGAPLGGRDVLVHGVLLQDAIGTNAPNGVFWSIAVEWHIYFFFPLLLLCARRWGRVSTVAAAALAVIGIHLVGSAVPLVAKLDRFTPQFFVLFVLGVVAATLPRRLGLAAAAAAMVLGVAVVGWLDVVGTRTGVSEFFWVDLAVGTATAALFVALASGRLAVVRRILSARALVAVGEFAFSIYLVHGPVIAIAAAHVVPRGWSAGERFAALLLVAAPVAVGLAWLFFLAFERPFLTIRSFGQLQAAVVRTGRILAPRRDAVRVVAEPPIEG